MKFAAFAAMSVAIATTTIAQNNFYQPGDLVLGFQNPGGSQGSDTVVLLGLGDSATIYRDATTNKLNIANIGAALTAAYGSTWYEQTTLYMSVVGVWGTSGLDLTTLQNGDPNRTLYAGRPRTDTGVAAGIAGSSALTVANNSGMTSGSSAMFSVGNSLETGSTTALGILTNPTALSTQNPVNSGLQGTAYGIFPGGIQDQFESGSWGTLGGLTVEGALDLYRIQAVNNAPSQYGSGNAIRSGEFQGTFVIDQAGSVSFVTTVPEPSTSLLLAMVGSAFLVGSRRRKMTVSPPAIESAF